MSRLSANGPICEPNRKLPDHLWLQDGFPHSDIHITLAIAKIEARVETNA
jgi:hypothetical protein